MAISVVSANRGTSSAKASSAVLQTPVVSALAAGNYALLAVVLDNPGTAEGATTYATVTDNSGAGNTWTRLREQTEANTAALTGVTVALFMAKLNAPLNAGAIVTVALTANATAKGAGLFELSCASGAEIQLSAGGATGTNAVAATSYSAALSGLTAVNGFWVGVTGAEEELGTSVGLDATFTELFGGVINSGQSGANATNVIARAGYKFTNLVTGETFDAAGLAAADRATILVRLEEVVTGRRARVGFVEFETPPAAAPSISSDPGSHTYVGVAASVVVGKVVNAETASVMAVTGADAALARGLFLDCTPTSYGISGFDTTLTETSQREINAEPASYAITGSDIPSLRDINAVPASYAITGVAADLVEETLSLRRVRVSFVEFETPEAVAASYSIDAQPTSYAVTGTDATLDTPRDINAEPTSYAITGVDATFAEGRFINAEPPPQAISVTGYPPELVYAQLFNAAPGAFAVTGNDGTILAPRDIDAQPGAVAVTGVVADLFEAPTHELDAQPASYAVTGSATAVVEDEPINAVPGSYAVTGSAATTVRVRKAAAGLIFLWGDPPLAGRSLNAEPGSLSILTLVQATLSQGTGFNAEPGSLTLTGFSTFPLHASLIAALTSSHEITGEISTLTTDKSLDAQPGAMAITGADAVLVEVASGTYTLDTLPGVFAVTASVTTVVFDRVVNAVPASWTWTGTVADIQKERQILTEYGEYAIDGSVAGTMRTPHLVAIEGVYVVESPDTRLRLIGRTIWNLIEPCDTVAGGTVITIGAPIIGEFIIGSQVGVSANTDIMALAAGGIEER